LNPRWTRRRLQVQINTGTGCHLEADMLARGLQELDPPPRHQVDRVQKNI